MHESEMITGMHCASFEQDDARQNMHEPLQLAA
jgi:hypothetical protein